MTSANLQLWKNLYTLFDEFTAMQPWTYLYETDIFGVKSPDTQQQYFISIMGTRGEVFGLAAYEGPLALHRFWDFYEYEAELGPESLLIFQKITKNNSKPRKLKFKSPYIEGVMRLIQKETNVETEHTFHLPSLDEAAQTMIEHLQNYGR